MHKYRILRGRQAQEEVLAVGSEEVFHTFELNLPKKSEEEKSAVAATAEEEKRRESDLAAQELLLQSMIQKAEAVLERAKQEADQIRSEAWEEGYKLGEEKGREAGRLQAWEEEQDAVREKIRALEEEIAHYVKDMEHQKEKVLEEYLDDLKNISLAIGEKIVQTSLKSSSEVIKKMIIAATEKLKKTAWARIYVSRTSEEMDLQGDAQLLRELAKLSDNVKIVIMEDTEPGTCIIELPQEIIDISAGAQMENIRDIVNNARL